MANRELASRCLTRAMTDVETWLALLEQGQLATVAPFGQMFIYQLKMRDKLCRQGVRHQRIVPALLSTRG